MTQEKNLELKNVGRSFGTTPIFKGIDLTAHDGEAVAVLGPSGMGKTTLLRIIGTIDNPTEGEVIICGKNIQKCGKDELADIRYKNIGYAFQEAVLLPGISSLENILLPFLSRLKKKDIARYEEKALNLLEEMGLKNKVNNKPHQLSVGQKKRVDLARALINDPNIVIVDEPTTNLDANSASIIRDKIRGVVDDGRTLVLTTHQDEELLKLAGIHIKIQDYQKY
ncbi:hypothetical protein A3K69_03840 [Candidatus Bathyarchaeota archaeon RBG_16_57_9]|nr:MAG: hypothetical protein A3K69_03840 [Candidatus Bathyarchaeota archaeon RBG_16_57_9]